MSIALAHRPILALWHQVRTGLLALSLLVGATVPVWSAAPSPNPSR